MERKIKCSPWELFVTARRTIVAPLFQNESYEHINRYEQRKKSSKKKKGLEPRITLRVISRLNPINQLFFYLFLM